MAGSIKSDSIRGNRKERLYTWTLGNQADVDVLVRLRTAVQNDELSQLTPQGFPLYRATYPQGYHPFIDYMYESRASERLLTLLINGLNNLEPSPDAIRVQAYSIATDKANAEAQRIMEETGEFVPVEEDEIKITPDDVKEAYEFLKNQGLAGAVVRVVYQLWSEPPEYEEMELDEEELRAFLDVDQDEQLGASEPRPLNFSSVAEYIIKGDNQCVRSYFETDAALKNYGKRRCANIVTEVDELKRMPTWRELAEIGDRNGLSVNVYGIDKKQIHQSITHKKVINIVPHDTHMYVIKNIRQFLSLKPKLKKLIKLPEEEFNKVVKEAMKTYNIAYRTSSRIVIGNQPYAVKYDNKFGELSEWFGFSGKFNDVDIAFKEGSGIRVPHFCDPNAQKHIDADDYVKMDLKHSYKSIVTNPTFTFPIPDGASILREYNGELLVKHHFYFVELPNTPPFDTFYFAQRQAWLYGHVIMLLKNLGFVFGKIEQEYVVNGERPGRAFLQEDGKEYIELVKGIKNEDGEIENITIRTEITNSMEVNEYVGVLARTVTDNEKIYMSSDNKELWNIRGRNPGSCFGCDRATGRKCISVSRRMYKESTGMPTFKAVIQYQMYNLIYLWCKIGKPKILSIRADAVGIVGAKHKRVVFDKLYKVGHVSYKREKVGKLPTNGVHDVRPLQNTPPPIYKDVEGFEIGKSMYLGGKAGMGKSKYIRTVVIPAIEAAGKTYLLTSTTEKNALSWQKKRYDEDKKEFVPDESDTTEYRPIQHHFRETLGIPEILNNLRKIDYLIVDECSMICHADLLMLLMLKREVAEDIPQCYAFDAPIEGHQLNLILIGDEHQIWSKDDVNQINHRMFVEAVDGRRYMKPWTQEDSRYSKEHSDNLDKLIHMPAQDMIPFLRKNFEFVDSSWMKEHLDAPNRLCYNHKWGMDNFGGKKLERYCTVHSAQGQTLEGIVGIGQVDKLANTTKSEYRRIFYTAMSRARGPKNIRLVL